MSIRVEETHIATVTNNDDPDKRGRIRVSCVGLLGEEDSEIPHWVEPVADWGWFIVPDIGELVEIVTTAASSDDEQIGQSSIDNLDLRWRGHRPWGNSEGSAKRPVPDDFKTNYGKRRGFATPGGHVFMFDDTKNSKKISLTWKGDGDADDGKTSYSYMAFDEDGSWICGNKNGSMIYMNAKDKELAIIDEHGNSITTKATGIAAIDKNGNVIETTAGGIQVTSQGDTIIKSAKMVFVDSANVQLAGAAAKAILGDDFITLYKAHTHPTGVGPSGPPANAAQADATLSTKVKLG